MKIKRPSLKGMKNTKYLGHFAQDKYIEKGHNLSGVLPVARLSNPNAAAQMLTNPFDLQQERARRQEIQRQGSLRDAGVLEQQIAQNQPQTNAYGEETFNQDWIDRFYRRRELEAQRQPLVNDPLAQTGLNKKKFIDQI